MLKISPWSELSLRQSLPHASVGSAPRPTSTRTATGPLASLAIAPGAQTMASALRPAASTRIDRTESPNAKLGDAESADRHASAMEAHAAALERSSRATQDHESQATPPAWHALAVDRELARQAFILGGRGV